MLFLRTQIKNSEIAVKYMVTLQTKSALRLYQMHTLSNQTCNNAQRKRQPMYS